MTIIEPNNPSHHLHHQFVHHNHQYIQNQQHDNNANHIQNVNINNGHNIIIPNVGHVQHIHPQIQPVHQEPVVQVGGHVVLGGGGLIK